MTNLSQYFKQATAKPPVVSTESEQTGRVIALIGGYGMESFAASLADAVPGSTIQAFPLMVDEVSTESQQMDVAQQKAMVDGIQTQLQEFAATHPATGPIHVYLLDGKGLAAGDEGSQATLSALAAAALSDPTHTVAAFLPEDQSLCAKKPGLPDGTPKAVEDVIHRFLDSQQAVSVEGLDGLAAYLNGMDKTSI
jgi:hypothetical protein